MTPEWRDWVKSWRSLIMIFILESGIWSCDLPGMVQYNVYVKCIVVYYQLIWQSINNVVSKHMTFDLYRFMQFTIAIVSVCIYSWEMFVSWAVNMWFCVCVCVEVSMTVTVKYNIKGITQVIIFIIIPCIIIIYSSNKHQHDLNMITIHTYFYSIIKSHHQ